MTVGEGVSVAELFRNEVPDPAGTASVFSLISSKLSVSSAASFLHRSEYSGPLSHLSHLISKHTALHHATIVSTECHSQSNRLGIVHRFLLMELARPGKRSIWLRLDRRRSDNVGVVGFTGAGLSTPANDTVRARLSSTDTMKC